MGDDVQVLVVSVAVGAALFYIVRNFLSEGSGRPNGCGGRCSCRAEVHHEAIGPRREPQRHQAVPLPMHQEDGKR